MKYILDIVPVSGANPDKISMVILNRLGVQEWEDCNFDPIIEEINSLKQEKDFKTGEVYISGRKAANI